MVYYISLNEINNYRLVSINYYSLIIVHAIFQVQSTACNRALKNKQISVLKTYNKNKFDNVVALRCLRTERIYKCRVFRSISQSNL